MFKFNPSSILIKKNKLGLTLLLSFAALLYHSTGLAAFEDIFYQNPSDSSIQFLGDIFGVVGNALIGQGNSILAQMFRVFNIVVLSLGTITVVYTVIASTLNTAQEGEVMGKKWSSMWLPLRSAAGLALLLPTSSGYSLIQIMMMTIIIKGINGGNAVYNTILDRAGEGQSIGASKQTVSNQALESQVMNTLNIASCVAYLNTYSNIINSGFVSVYPVGNQLYIGVQNDPTYQKICGTVAMSNNPNAEKITPESWQDVQITSGESALQVASGYASEAMQPDQAAWATSGAKTNTARAMKSPLVSVKIEVSNKDFNSLLLESKKAGWLYAGANYFKLLSPDGIQDYKPTPPVFSYNKEGLDNLGISVNGLKLGTYIQTQTANYIVQTNGGDILGSDGDMLSKVRIATSGSAQLPGEAGGWASKLVSHSGLGDSFASIRSNLVSSQGDALSSMRKIGTDIMKGIEISFWSMLAITLAFTLWLCIMEGMQPGCSFFLTFISIVIPVLMFFMAMLWGVGVLLGLYIPMIPYLVFTFSALAWFIMVIEAIVAAPIVSLGLVAPSGENLGKASGAVLLIANIFMRPSLMVIGLVIAAKLLDVAVKMLNFGFDYFMTTIGGSSYGFFADIVLLIIYGGIVIALTHECFTLIHVLPDKVNRWIGGHAEQSGVAKQMGEMQKSVQTASQTSMQMMQGGAKAIGEMKEIIEKNEAKKKEAAQMAAGMPPAGGGVGGGGA